MLTKPIFSFLIFIALSSQTLAGNGYSISHADGDNNEKINRRSQANALQFSSSDLIKTAAKGAAVVFAGYNMASYLSSENPALVGEICGALYCAYKITSCLNLCPQRQNTDLRKAYREQQQNYSVQQQNLFKRINDYQKQQNCYQLSEITHFNFSVEEESLLEENSLIIDLHGDIYNKNVCQNLLQKICEYKRYLLNGEDIVISIIPGTFCNVTGKERLNYPNPDNIERWLLEPDFQKLISCFWHHEVGYINAILRKDPRIFCDEFSLSSGTIHSPVKELKHKGIQAQNKNSKNCSYQSNHEGSVSNF